MLTTDMKKILASARNVGWVLEPEAKRLFSMAGIQVPPFAWVHSENEALAAGEKLGFPLAAKIVSPDILHKSDAGGVAIGIKDTGELADVFNRFRSFTGFDGVLVEPMLSGVELIVGGKVDYQFGPVVLLGIGGTSVEIYQDTAVRMAPLSEIDIRSMVAGLKGSRLLTGYRGSRPIDMDRMTQLLMRFSTLLTEMAEQVESIDLNPVICSETDCMVADARIILQSGDRQPI